MGSIVFFVITNLINSFLSHILTFFVSTHVIINRFNSYSLGWGADIGSILKFSVISNLINISSFISRITNIYIALGTFTQFAYMSLGLVISSQHTTDRDEGLRQLTPLPVLPSHIVVMFIA